MKLLAQSRSKIADIVADRLTEHYASDHAAPSFFALPGQDPTAFELPAQSLSALYWQGTDKQRSRFVGVLLDLAGRQAQSLPLKALQSLLLTVGSIEKPEALLPFVRVLGARTDLGDKTFNLFGIALQVAKGFGLSSDAWDSVYEMVGFRSFPEKLVFDAFDICVVDHRSTWERWFIRLEPAMMRVTNVSRRIAMERRIARTASSMAKRMSANNIERGLKTLLGQHAFHPHNNDWHASQLPRHLLAHSMLLALSAPLIIRQGDRGQYFLELADLPRLPGIAPSTHYSMIVPSVFQSLGAEPDETKLLAEV